MQAMLRYKVAAEDRLRALDGRQCHPGPGGHGPLARNPRVRKVPAMKSPRSARRVALAVHPDGRIEGRIHAPKAALPGEIAMVLDGTMHALLRPEPAGRGTVRFSAQLPDRLVFEALDLLAGPEGESLLGLPHPLDSVYGVEAGPATLTGNRLEGSFTGAAFLADAIGVDLLGPGGLAGRAIARRNGAGLWRYATDFATLPKPGEAIRLQARIGGRLLPTCVLELPPGALGVIGCLDVATPERVEGWAVDLRDPKRRVALDVVCDTEVVAGISADRGRDDLRQSGLGDGFGGFAATLPEPATPSARRRISVRLAGTRTELSGSPLIIDPAPAIAGRLDTLHGRSLHGWAWDRNRPKTPLTVEAVGPEGEILGRAVANQFRGDLLGAGLADGLCAFRIDLSGHYERLMGREIIARVAGTDLVLPGSPQRILPNLAMQRFLRRRDIFQARPGALPRLKRALNHRAGNRAISLIMPVFNTKRQWLSEALESVRRQFCDHWELICIDDGSTEPHVQELLRSYAARDPRVRVLHSPDNVGIQRAVNFGLRAARHDYVAFVDHDDYLEPDAVWQLIRAAAETDADLIYSDEVLTDDTLNGILEFRLRPAFSHDYYLSHPYFVHLVCVRTDLARRIGGYDESLTISGDVDFVLRAIEASRHVAHVPAVLYRWRTHPDSTGHAKQEQVMAATIGALQRHLDRLGTGARVSEGPWFNQFRIDWPAATGRILIVIPTKNGRALLEKAVTSIERTAGTADYHLVVIDHQSDDPATRAYLSEIASRHTIMPYEGEFNFSRMNNMAVARYGDGAEFILFLNNDIEATESGWLERLSSLAARPGIGAVGALLMYEDQRVQHAGVVIGFNNSADHSLRMQDVFHDRQGRRNLGYNCALTSVRDYSAVTAACLMMRRSVFEEIQGFDESFGIGFNDTDLCLRVRDAGYRVLYDGYTMLFHYESATRSQTKQVFHPADTKRMVERWAGLLASGDPFYNPNLSLRTQDHVPREDSGCRIIHKPRVVERRS